VINWQFVKEQEGTGAVELTGTVPDVNQSHSGVTIASGVDLGSKDQRWLEGWDMTLQVKLRNYVGLRGVAAMAAIQLNPLHISAEEAQLLDFDAEAEVEQILANHLPHWHDLHDEVQTVIASVTYQYGTPWTRCPRFWQCALDNNVGGMINELEDFGDHYASRRDREAALLRPHVH
jgi:type VI secretion system secreted protein VgrG